MDAMVSARVPAEIKRQVDDILHNMGSSATELINTAYEYVLQHQSLPEVRKVERSPEPIVRVVKGEEARRIREEWARLRVGTIPEYDGTNFKELLDKARDERYARFS